MNCIWQVGLRHQWNWFNRQRKWGGEGRTSPKGETDETKKKGMWKGLRKEKREEGKKRQNRERRGERSGSICRRGAIARPRCVGWCGVRERSGAEMGLAIFAEAIPRTWVRTRMTKSQRRSRRRDGSGSICREEPEPPNRIRCLATDRTHHWATVSRLCWSVVLFIRSDCHKHLA